MLLAGIFGCAPSLPVYPGTPGLAEVTMKPYTADKAQFSLPPGWTFEPWDPNKPALTGYAKFLAGKGTVGILKKESKGNEVGGVLSLFCWGGFVAKASMPEIANDSILKNMPDAVLIKAYQVEVDEGMNPLFEIYSGTIATGGAKAPVYGYAGSKWTPGFGCRYTLSGFAPQQAGASFERDFVAILRSLKN
jgi:hypothetical protein